MQICTHGWGEREGHTDGERGREGEGGGREGEGLGDRIWGSIVCVSIPEQSRTFKQS